MGLFSFITTPARVAAHVAGSGVGRAASGATGYFSAKVAMNNTRFQLRSYEARELFDSKRLAKHFKLYHKIMKHLKRYRADKHGRCPRIEKAYHKHRDNPDVLKHVLAHEVKVFADYYYQLLQVISTIEMEESDLELQRNASLIRDIREMKTLVQEIPHIARKEDVTLIEDDLKEFFRMAMDKYREERRRDLREIRERRREEKEKKGVRGFAAMMSGFTGVGHLSHKVKKLVKRVATHDMRKFNENFNELQSDIRNRKISAVTISNLRYLLQNYASIRKYYAEIDKDMVLLMDKLFHEFHEVMDECVIPFYAAVKNIEGAKVILQITERLKEIYMKNIQENRKEEFEIRAVYLEMARFAFECKKAMKDIASINEQVISDLRAKEMNVMGEHAFA